MTRAILIVSGCIITQACFYNPVEVQITGVEQRTRGEIIFDGRPVDFDGPLDAREAGMETVFQTLALADHLALGPVAVAGHSLGGMIALAMAARGPAPRRSTRRKAGRCSARAPIPPSPSSLPTAP